MDRIITLLELVGLGCLAGFAYLVWPPAVLLVLGAAAILTAWTLSRTPSRGAR